ncbi:MAG TPA: SurA N-terminal domain-containing protein [Vicinamibacteria bacterium]|nr:SurA N-terminal domain-containing protein [Vicinamibacteria bacterium]
MLKYFRNRKSLGWLVGAFLLVLVIFAFVAFYIPDFMTGTGVAGSGEVAWVEGTPISSQEFLRSYRAQEQQYRQQLGSQFSPDLLRQLGFDNLVLRQLVQNQILFLEAQRQGISVTDQEVSEFIVSLPMFQSDGKFIGRDAYLNLLARNSLSASQFEAQLRQDVMRQKLQSLVTDGIVVPDADIEEEYRRRNEKLRLEYAFVAKAEFEAQVQVTDEEARRFFDDNKKRFERPVQRKVRFITLTPQLFASAVSVSDREVERYYQQNSSRYETGDQLAASHILFKTGPDTDEEAVRKKAEAVLALAKGGADFAELARQHSEDTSAENGGDLGLFGRGQMVPEFEAAAFALQEGQISDLVRSTYGFHIIKLNGREAAFIRPLDSMRDEIRNTITQEKARDKMEKAVDSAAEKLRASGSVDALSAEYPVLVPQETAFFGRGDTLPQLGNSPEATRAAFENEVGQVSSSVRLGNGYAFLHVLEERPAGTPDFEEVKEEARNQLRDQKVMKLAQARAEALRETLLTEGPEKAGIELLSTESFFRGSQLPEAGRSAAVNARAFAISPGELSAPLSADNGFVLVRVLEKTGFSPADFAAQKPGFLEQMANEQRLKVWNAFVESLTARYDVRVDWQAIRAITG